MEIQARRPAVELEGKICVITGAGSGVGRAVANLFVRNGASVMVADVVESRVDQVVGELKAHGGRVEGMTVDLSRADAPETMIDRAENIFGKIDVLCNNAGIMDGVVPVAETSDELWQRVMDINLNAPFRASRRAIPSMLKNEGGVIINTASVAGLFGGLAGAAYTTSKHALIGLTRSIAATYGSQGIRCNAMVLGGVKTNIGVGSATPNPKGMEHLMKATSLMPRLAEPEEVADVAVFLASPKSNYLNGACLVADAGWTLL